MRQWDYKWVLGVIIVVCEIEVSDGFNVESPVYDYYKKKYIKFQSASVY